MSITCTRCEYGWLNLHQIPEDERFFLDSPEAVGEWWERNQHKEHDVQVCDCCGDGEDWYDVPGEHYNNGDIEGEAGPYSYNGGLCECN